MSVQQVGTRYVRNFGYGEKFRTVITEVVDNKIFTKVLDSNNNVIRNRVKAFFSEELGNKLVKTRTDVLAQENEKYKIIYNRVYDKKDKSFLGTRIEGYEITDAGLKKHFSMKQAKGTDRYLKEFDTETKLVQSKTLMGLEKSDVVSGYPLGAYSVEPIELSSISYNAEGLPMSPALYDSGINCNEKSLKELVALHRQIAPDCCYSKNLNLDFLDKHYDKSYNINNLDRYI